jgi:hypothetical protein
MPWGTELLLVVVSLVWHRQDHLTSHLWGTLPQLAHGHSCNQAVLSNHILPSTAPFFNMPQGQVENTAASAKASCCHHKPHASTRVLAAV